MQQLTYLAPRTLAWRDVPEPDGVAADAAVVRPLAVATCDLDLAVLARQGLIDGPFAFGHEFVGEVVATGSAVRSVAAGARVAVPFQISCGACPECRRGLTASCSAVAPLAGYGLGRLGGLGWGGALTDLVRVPYADAMLVPVPTDVDPALLASLSDNLPDAHRTVRDVRPGEEVLVVGGGSIGVLAAGMAVAAGARVRYVDTDASRCGIAEGYGARVDQRVLDAPVAPAERVVHTSARPDQLVQALLSVAPGGVLVDTGVYWGRTTPVPLFAMYTTGVTLTTGRANARAGMPAVLDLVREGRFDPTPVLTVRASWEDAAEALLQPTVKTVVSRA